MTSRKIFLFSTSPPLSPSPTDLPGAAAAAAPSSSSSLLSPAASESRFFSSLQQTPATETMLCLLATKTPKLSEETLAENKKRKTPMNANEGELLPNAEHTKRLRNIGVISKEKNSDLEEGNGLLARENDYVVKRIDARRFGTENQIVGEGVYGVVYMTSMRYVVKCIRRRPLELDNVEQHKEAEQHKEGEKSLQVQTLREIAVLRNMAHPNVIRVQQVSFSQSSDDTCIARLVLPYCRTTLRALLRERDWQPIENRASILYQLLRAVAFVHSRNVLHRDVKPENVLYGAEERGASAEKEEKVVLADFGLAQGNVLEGLAVDQDRRNINTITLFYRPPEILLADANYGFGVDVWSVGSIWLEMIGVDALRSTSELDQLERSLALFNDERNDWLEKVAPTLPFWKKYQSHLAERDNRMPPLQPLTKNSRFTTLGQKEQDLLRRLLNIDPRRRITARGALEHSYFDDVRTSIEKRIPSAPLLDFATHNQSLFVMEFPVTPAASCCVAIRNHFLLETNAWMVNHLYNGRYYHIYSLSTIALAVSMLYRFLATDFAQKTVRQSKLRQYAFICFFIATKLESEISPMDDDFLPHFDSVDSGVEKERQVLTALDMDVNRPTVATFWRMFSSGAVAMASGGKEQQQQREEEENSDVETRLQRGSEKILEYLKKFDRMRAWRGSQLAYAAMRFVGLDSPCVAFFETNYTPFFNADIVEQIGKRN